MNRTEIIEANPSICYFCELSIATADSNMEKGYVGCVLRMLPKEKFWNGGNGDSFDYDQIQEADEIAEGWIYNKRAPFQNKEGYSSGIMTNYQLLTRGVIKCKSFQRKTED